MMNHLTTDEILDFVSMTEYSSEALQKCAAVIGHTRECEKCLQLVQAFQRIHEAFEELGVDMDFKKYARSVAEVQMQEPEKEKEKDIFAPER